MNETDPRLLDLRSGFTMGPWRVEPERNAITRDGVEKHLENRLMQTLVFLAQHHGEIIPREQFFDAVWQGLVVNEEALSRAISLLRAALEDNAHKPRFIQTIPGAGYRLIAQVQVTQHQKHDAPSVSDIPDRPSQEEQVLPPARHGKSVSSGKVVTLRQIFLTIVLLFLGFFILERFVLHPEKYEPGIDTLNNETAAPGAAESLIDNSIAILPFVNMSSDPEQEYFADGMTEELLNLLAAVPKLRVTARTSSFFFKGKNLPVSQIAQTLNVKHVLEGSIRRNGSRVRITAQLVEAHSDRHLWSKTYNREMRDIFAIQDEVATAIASELVDSFHHLEVSPVSRTKSLAAYEAYRTGRLRWWRRSVPELHEAIELFTKAIESDPGFAPAYAALADSRMLLVMYGDMHIMEGSELAEKDIEKALELDPESAQAFAARGLSRLIVGRKEEAETALRQAISLDDTYIPAYLWMSSLLSDLGRVPEEGSILLKAMEMDPLNEMLAINYAENLQTRGDSEGAKNTLSSLLRLQQDHVGLLCAMSGILLNNGELVEGWKAARQAYALEPENVVVINSMANAWMYLDELAEAEKVWVAGLKQNRKSVELKTRYLSMLLIQGRIEDAEVLIDRLFGKNVGDLPIGFQRTYHYFMGLLSAVKMDYPKARDHFEQVVDPVVDQLFDRNQIFVLTTASLINNALGESDIAEKQLLTAERVVGHARVDGIDNAAIYYSVTSLFAMRGDKDRALQTLQQTYGKGFRQNWLLEQDGRISILREEPAFLAIRKQIAEDIEQAQQEARQLLASENDPSGR